MLVRGRCSIESCLQGGADNDETQAWLPTEAELDAFWGSDKAEPKASSENANVSKNAEVERRAAKLANLHDTEKKFDSAPAEVLEKPASKPHVGLSPVCMCHFFKPFPPIPWLRRLRLAS